MFGMKDFNSLLSDSQSMKFSFDEIKDYFDDSLVGIDEDTLDILIKYFSLSEEDKSWFISYLDSVGELNEEN